MLQIFAVLALLALGMGVDAYYQRRIRIAECDSYITGYQQGKKEEKIRLDAQAKMVGVEPANAVQQKPSMAAPVAMPDNFEEHLRKHGRATARVK